MIIVEIMLITLLCAFNLLMMVLAWNMFEETRLGDMFVDWLEGRKEE